MSDAKPYRTLFVGTLVQESFLSLGGTDDPFTTVDSPFCRNGEGRPTLRGTSLAGTLIATLRRLKNGAVPSSISGSEDGRQPSAWRFFNSHADINRYAYRQHVAIHPETGAADDGALFNVETLPPGTKWPFLLEADTSRDPVSAADAENTLAHWAAGRCLLGREVARGMGWMRLTNLRKYTIGENQVHQWPNAEAADDYPAYIESKFGAGSEVPPASQSLPGWIEIEGTLHAGENKDGEDVWGIDSLSIGGHASEELEAVWDKRFLAPKGIKDEETKAAFDPDFAVVTWNDGKQRVPYIPGSSLRGPLRHALSRTPSKHLVNELFGTVSASAKLLIRDALPDPEKAIKLAWIQHHAEDEFAGSTYESAKFDRVAVMEGSFRWKMVLEDATDDQKAALRDLLVLAQAGQIGIGGGQWRGHGWLRWETNGLDQLQTEPNVHA